MTYRNEETRTYPGGLGPTPEPGTPAPAEPPAGCFLNPTPVLISFLVSLLPPGAEKCAFVDIGAGRGYLSARLNEALAGRPMCAVLALENLTPGESVYPLLPMDATTFKYLPNFFPVIARPCHGTFPEAAIRRAVAGSGFCIYVGLEKNVSGDLAFTYDELDRYNVAHVVRLSGTAGEDGEGVWLVGDPDRPEYAALLERARPADPSPFDDFDGHDAGTVVGWQTPTASGSYVIGVDLAADPDAERAAKERADFADDMTEDARLSDPAEAARDEAEMYAAAGRSDEGYDPDPGDEPGAEEDEDDGPALRVPTPVPPCARLGYVAPNGDFYPCAYCGHRELGYLLAEAHLTREDRSYYSGRDALEKAGWLALMGGGLISCASSWRWTPEQTATVAALIAAFAEAEAKDGADRLEVNLRRDLEGYGVQTSWFSSPWNDEEDGTPSLQKMQETYDYETGAAPVGELVTPPSYTDAGVNYNRRFRPDGTPDGD